MKSDCMKLGDGADTRMIVDWLGDPRATERAFSPCVSVVWLKDGEPMAGWILHGYSPELSEIWLTAATNPAHRPVSIPRKVFSAILMTATATGARRIAALVKCDNGMALRCATFMRFRIEGRPEYYDGARWLLGRPLGQPEPSTLVQRGNGYEFRQ